MNLNPEAKTGNEWSRLDFSGWQVYRCCALLLVMAVTFTASGCGLDFDSSSSANDYRQTLAVTDVQSFLYREPGTQKEVPQVRGLLRNLGNHTLVVVEFTLYYKDRLNQTIFQETAYPIYVSSLSNGQSGKALGPGQQVRFAFKSPACPRDWEPGQVSILVTKVVEGHS